MPEGCSLNGMIFKLFYLRLKINYFSLPMIYREKIFYTLMFLPLVISMIALIFLPDLIPAHYNIKNEIDRWGSKYEILIIPIITILLGKFLLFMKKWVKKYEVKGNNNEKFILIIGICLLLIYNIILYMMIYLGLSITV